jgi:hypothetical protein
MEVGDLVLWLAPDKTVVIALVVEKVSAHGGGHTGWWRVFTDLGRGAKKFLALEKNCEVLRRRSA